MKHAQINMSLAAVWNISWKIRKKNYTELDDFKFQIQFQIRDWNKKILLNRIHVIIWC